MPAATSHKACCFELPQACKHGLQLLLHKSNVQPCAETAAVTILTVCCVGCSRTGYHCSKAVQVTRVLLHIERTNPEHCDVVAGPDPCYTCIACMACYLHCVHGLLISTCYSMPLQTTLMFSYLSCAKNVYQPLQTHDVVQCSFALLLVALSSTQCMSAAAFLQEHPCSASSSTSSCCFSSSMPSTASAPHPTGAAIGQSTAPLCFQEPLILRFARTPMLSHSE